METSQPTIKHWRAFGVEEWGHVKEGVLGLVLGSLLPVALFYMAYQTWGFSIAVVTVLSWSAAVFAWHYRRGKGADVFSATTFGFACVKAAAGLVSQTTLPEGAPISAVTLYLAWPSLENLIYGTAFLGSALLGRPLLALFAQRLYPIPVSVRGTLGGVAVRPCFAGRDTPVAAGHAAPRAVFDRRYGRGLADQREPGRVYDVVSAAPIAPCGLGVWRAHPPQRGGRDRARRRRGLPHHCMSVTP